MIPVLLFCWDCYWEDNNLHEYENHKREKTSTTAAQQQQQPCDSPTTRNMHRTKPPPNRPTRHTKYKQTRPNKHEHQSNVQYTHRHSREEDPSDEVGAKLFNLLWQGHGEEEETE